MNASTRFHQATAAIALLAVAACGDSTGPGDDAVRVAFTEVDASGTATLNVQNLDGTDRSRIHFDGVSDNVPGNLPPFILPVTDQSIRAIGPVRWSPDGSRIAAIVTVAFDQSQVVVMDADGGAKRTASPNTQVIASNVAWSPDGTRIAYAMSTGPAVSGVDLFMTEIGAGRVTPLTTGASLGGPGVSIAWSADGTAVLWSLITDTGPAPLFERLSRINRIDIANAQESTVAVDVSGEVHGISTDGVSAVIVRNVAEDGASVLREAFVRNLADGTETTLTNTPDAIAWAAFTSGEDRVLIATDFMSVSLRFRLFEPDGSGSEPLDIAGIATSVDLGPAR